MALTDTLHRLGKLIGLYADEEVEYEEQYEEYEQPETYDTYYEEPERPAQRQVQSKQQPMGGYGTGSSYVRAGGAAPRTSRQPMQPQDDEPQPLYSVPGGRRNAPRDEKILPLPTQRDESVRSRHSEIIICVRRLEDSEDIINCMLGGQSVILNFEEIDDVQFQRVLDMLSGAAFALHGAIQRISKRIYLLAPASVEVVSGDPQRARTSGRVDMFASSR